MGSVGTPPTRLFVLELELVTEKDSITSSSSTSSSKAASLPTSNPEFQENL
jgi:hypothetical protein